MEYDAYDDKVTLYDCGRGDAFNGLAHPRFENNYSYMRGWHDVIREQNEDRNESWNHT